MIESASCVAARNAGSKSPADTAGAFGVSAEATRRQQRAGVSVSYRSPPARFARESAAEERETARPREVLSFTVCPGSASGCRSR
jgi:hypothetical protein